MVPPHPLLDLVFRFFAEPDHALALTRGDVWVSTLEECRRKEDPDRKDELEATFDYFSGDFAAVDADSPEAQLVAGRLGNYIGAGRYVSIKNCRAKQKIRDAYVLCFTIRDRPWADARFGEFGTSLGSVDTFEREVTDALRLHLGDPHLWSDSGTVVYADLQYAGLAPAPGRLGFVKRPRFEVEEEYRLCFFPSDRRRKLVPFLLPCPQLAGHCELLPRQGQHTRPVFPRKIVLEARFLRGEKTE